MKKLLLVLAIAAIVGVVVAPSSQSTSDVQPLDGPVINPGGGGGGN